MYVFGVYHNKFSVSLTGEGGDQKIRLIVISTGDEINLAILAIMSAADLSLKTI